ncbi:hypothetical protein POX_b02196 [Penicillium oxalicum]|uniref:hypothetical protein n=1 Tax=Penicillium oxalicum TaxID=69781 RepID=UPI0020B80B9C|nr:hypothetical protein POX_b02196 [Penicillium oxalicum]KAI2792159.1 hypothetical protein POX_b02196 [Penicillium oxalicum]
MAPGTNPSWNRPPASPSPSRNHWDFTKKLSQYATSLERYVSNNPQLSRILTARDQQPRRPFVSDGSIRLLPRDCQMNIFATDVFPGAEPVDLLPFRMQMPTLDPVPVPTRLVGKVKAHFDPSSWRQTGPVMETFGPTPELQPGPLSESTSRSSFNLVVDPPPPFPGQNVLLRPKPTSPFYDLVTDSETVLDSLNVDLHRTANDHVQRLRILLDLLDTWDSALALRFATFTLQARTWRRDRRGWELEMVQDAFFTGNLHMLHPDFTVHSLVNARLHVERENQKEREGQVEAWLGVMNRETWARWQAHQMLVRNTAEGVERMLSR